MTHKEYNGWTNYETFVVKAWMDEEEAKVGWEEDCHRYGVEMDEVATLTVTEWVDNRGQVAK